MFKSIFRVSSITLLIKPLGYIRDIFIAALSGISFYSDVIYLTLRIPFAFKAIFTSSPYQSAFIPIFITLKMNDERQAINHGLTILIISIILLLPVLIVSEIYMNSIIYFFNFDFIQGQNDHDFAVLISRIMLPYLLFILMSATLLSILYSYEKFILGSLLPVIINILAISILFIFKNFDTDTIVLFLSISIIIGSILEVIVLFIYLRNILKINRFKFVKVALGKFFRLLVPSISNDIIYQGTKFVNVIIAANFLGGISALYFSSQVAALPIAIFGVTLSTVLIPRLSLLSIEDKQKKIEIIIECIRASFIFILPTVGFLFFFSEMILTALYQRGEFDLIATAMSSNLLKAYAIGIFPLILNRILLIFYYSKLNTLRPFLMYLITFVINIFILFLFYNTFGLTGIALALSISLCIYTLIIIVDLYFNGVIIFNFYLIVAFIKYSTITLIMIIFQKITYNNYLVNYDLYNLVKLFMLIIFGGLIFLSLLVIFDNKYITSLKNRVINSSVQNTN